MHIPRHPRRRVIRSYLYSPVIYSIPRQDPALKEQVQQLQTTQAALIKEGKSKNVVPYVLGAGAVALIVATLLRKK